jgi:hypothetical protein
VRLVLAPVVRTSVARDENGKGSRRIPEDSLTLGHYVLTSASPGVVPLAASSREMAGHNLPKLL